MDLNNIIKQTKSDGKYHFFILYCRALFPFNFSKHFRVVTIDNGNTNRFEVCHFKNKKSPNLGYIYINLVEPGSGLKKYIWKTNKYRTPYIAYHISGYKNSLAQKIVSFVENSLKSYPYISKYILFPGPNSNTYIQWILNNFPQIKFQLPRNAFGKNFKFK